MFLVRTELGLGWLAQLGLGKPTRVRRRPARGASPFILNDAPVLLADFKKKNMFLVNSSNMGLLQAMLGKGKSNLSRYLGYA